MNWKWALLIGGLVLGASLWAYQSATGVHAFGIDWSLVGWKGVGGAAVGLLCVPVAMLAKKKEKP